VSRSPTDFRIAHRTSQSFRARLRVRETGCTGWGEPMPALRRREFITLLGGAIVWPLSARAQQPLVGFMSSRAPDDSVDVVVAFRRGLGERGVIEGRNVLVEFRWANGDYARLPALSARALSCHSPVRRLAQPEIPGRRAAGAGTVRSGAHSRSADRISE